MEKGREEAEKRQRDDGKGAERETERRQRKGRETMEKWRTDGREMPERREGRGGEEG